LSCGIGDVRDFPHRFHTIAANPGELLKRSERNALPADQPNDGQVYLKLVRQLPCLCCGLEDCSEAAHVRMNSGLFNKRQAMAKKPDQKWVLPLCSGCHWRDPNSLHKTSEHLFWPARVGLNPLLICERLYAKRGDIVAMRAVVIQAIAERTPGVVRGEARRSSSNGRPSSDTVALR
jgi:hypothetical protein